MRRNCQLAASSGARTTLLERLDQRMIPKQLMWTADSRGEGSQALALDCKQTGIKNDCAVAQEDTFLTAADCSSAHGSSDSGRVRTASFVQVANQSSHEHAENGMPAYDQMPLSASVSRGHMSALRYVCGCMAHVQTARGART